MNKRGLGRTGSGFVCALCLGLLFAVGLAAGAPADQTREEWQALVDAAWGPSDLTPAERLAIFDSFWFSSRGHLLAPEVRTEDNPTGPNGGWPEWESLP